MTKTLVVAALAVAANGCSDFLSGDKLDSDPNKAPTAKAEQLLVASQANSYYILNGHAARVLAMWMQQMAGTDRQYRGYDQYSITEGLFAEYSAAYTGGGLIDLRAIQADADAADNRIMSGIAKVWEALVMSFLADMYGDASYSQAVDDIAHPLPTLDTQADIYAALQTVLDGAIADLASGEGAVDVDLSLDGDPDAWIAVANTLKARIHLHTAEVLGNSAYQAALAALCASPTPSAPADLPNCHIKGIRSTSGDLNSTAAPRASVWWQFIARDRDSYMRPGKFLVDLMVDRDDPRVDDYFQENGSGGYGGAAPGEGLDAAKHSNLGLTRLDPAYHQPIVTYLDAGNHRRVGVSHQQPCSGARRGGCADRDVRRDPGRRHFGNDAPHQDPRGEVHRAVPELRGLQRLEAHLLSEPDAGE
jgi:hypothetical protein